MNSDTLRKEIRNYALAFADRRRLKVDISHPSAVIFTNLADNFYPDSYKNILTKTAWKARTNKAHQVVQGVKEMQSSNSSDALLMNIFCHPSIQKWSGIKRLLRNCLNSITFGFPGEVLFKNGKMDGTEIDMALSNVFCEAKLTESDFTKKEPSDVDKYDMLRKYFHVKALPRAPNNDYENYQIIRNLLASIQHDRDHILFCDERRPDLVRSYLTTVSCLQDVQMRMRCRVIFWQEIVAVCDKSLCGWIKEKYGI